MNEKNEAIAKEEEEVFTRSRTKREKTEATTRTYNLLERRLIKAIWVFMSMSVVLSKKIMLRFKKTTPSTRQTLKRNIWLFVEVFL